MASTLTVRELLESQESLVKEAAMALPHQFSKCTYSLGPLRQAIYLCLTCPEARGLCSACSIACHTDHEQVELFPKRNFRCDCPTAAIAHPCSLHERREEENATNRYGHNFQGAFCRCGRPYDAKTERETMIQCLACEDWFHESCCNLREPPSSNEPSPDFVTQSPVDQIDDDTLSEASSSGLPPPLISGDNYESFVCASCVSQIPTLQRWAGTYGTMMVVRPSLVDSWTCLNGDLKPVDDETVIIEETLESHKSSATRLKRTLSPSVIDLRNPKKARSCSVTASASSICIAPAPQSVPQKIFSMGLPEALDRSTSLGTGDIFLKEGFRSRWCHCENCLPSLHANPFLLEEEETYEPPEDPDSGLSLEELGMRALERIPRERAIDGIHAFNEMKDDLVNFLRPFAQEDKVVNEDDVKNFFASLKEASQKNLK
ncbi:hypothetical protein BDQ17DRAFT_1392469 [Cyathus striatus]|nr:hypothetical protein BDQ17DRAFT_1392469 [Cyathus striatus]